MFLHNVTVGMHSYETLTFLPLASAGKSAKQIKLSLLIDLLQKS